MSDNVHVISRNKREVRLLVDNPDLPLSSCSYSNWGLDEVRESINSLSIKLENVDSYNHDTKSFMGVPDWEKEPNKLYALSIIVYTRKNIIKLRYCNSLGAVFEEEIGDGLFRKEHDFWNMRIIRSEVVHTAN